MNKWLTKLQFIFNYGAKIQIKIKIIFQSIVKSEIVSNYIAHNKASFRKFDETTKSIILCELNDMHSSHIAYSYLSNTLAKKYSAKIIAYVPRPIRGVGRKIIFKFKVAFKLNEIAVYQSFGVAEFICARMLAENKKRSIELREKIVEDIQFLSNREKKFYLENLVINDVWVGDLFYDTYLMSYERPTIDFDDPQFVIFLEESLGLYYFWEKYFNINDIKSVIVSHCVYNIAIPLRIAVSRDIPAFQATSAAIYRLGKANCFAYSDFHYYPRTFSKLPLEVRDAGKMEAKRRIERRFKGEVGVDMSYSTKSAFSLPSHDCLIQPSNRKKILIATHCFFDSPHSYGNNIFPDIYEWLEFLGEMTLRTDYDWYIKTHPDYWTGTMKVIKEFLNKYPRIILLPSNASHHQIIAEGIDVALTVWGTIGFEYAALDMPVINCSLNNPHIAYGFNLHPSSVQEYENLLLDLDSLNLKIDKESVYEYYFMNKIYNSENIIFDDWQATLREMGGHAEQFTPKVYSCWMKEWSKQRHLSIAQALNRFVAQEDFRLDYQHFSSVSTATGIEGTTI